MGVSLSVTELDGLAGPWAGDNRFECVVPAGFTVPQPLFFDIEGNEKLRPPGTAEFRGVGQVRAIPRRSAEQARAATGTTDWEVMFSRGVPR